MIMILNLNGEYILEFSKNSCKIKNIIKQTHKKLIINKKVDCW